MEGTEPTSAIFKKYFLQPRKASFMAQTRTKFIQIKWFLNKFYFFIQTSFIKHELAINFTVFLFYKCLIITNKSYSFIKSTI